jgi:HK97 family phage portal protein
VTLLAGVFRNSLEDPNVPLTSENFVELFGDRKSGSGIRVSETRALSMAAVFRAVTFKAGVSASLPLHAFVDVAGKRMPADAAPSRMIESPHPDMTPFEFWETVYSHIDLWGNAYLRILRGRPANAMREFWPIHPGRVKVGRTSETGKKIYAIDGDSEVHDDTTILHIPGFGYDGICGVSPIRLARNSIGLGLAAEEFGGTLFGNGSLATGILQTEQRLTPEQADALHKRWEAKQSGLKSAHKTIVLDRGAKFTQLTIPPEDAQFLETRHFQISEVCRWYGIPPFLMYETEKSSSWGTGLEQQALGWVVYDLRRSLVRVEQRLTQLLAKDYEDHYAQYSVEGLLRGDSKSRAAFYTAMFNLGAYSTNDILKLEDRPPVDGGDVRYRPLNLGILGEADSDPDADPPAIPESEPEPEEEPANAVT